MNNFKKNSSFLNILPLRIKERLKITENIRLSDIEEIRLKPAAPLFIYACKKEYLLSDERGDTIIVNKEDMKSNAELGKKALRPENIIRLCTAMEISTDYLLLGNVSGDDISKLSQKVSRLTPDQYRHLEDIIDSYMAAVQGTSQGKC